MFDPGNATFQAADSGAEMMLALYDYGMGRADLPPLLEGITQEQAAYLLTDRGRGDAAGWASSFLPLTVEAGAWRHVPNERLDQTLAEATRIAGHASQALASFRRCLEKRVPTPALPHRA